MPFNPVPPQSYSGSRTEITSDYQATPTDSFVAVVGFSAQGAPAAPITIGLPDPMEYGPGDLVVKDESGQASAGLAITVSPPVGFTINGAAAGLTITAAYGFVRLYSSGAQWFTR